MESLCYDVISIISNKLSFVSQIRYRQMNYCTLDIQMTDFTDYDIHLHIQ